MVDMYRARNPHHTAAPPGGGAAPAGLSAGQPVMSTLPSADHESSRIKKLERLIKKKL